MLPPKPKSFNLFASLFTVFNEEKRHKLKKSRLQIVSHSKVKQSTKVGAL